MLGPLPITAADKLLAGASHLVVTVRPGDSLQEAAHLAGAEVEVELLAGAVEVGKQHTEAMEVERRTVVAMDPERHTEEMGLAQLMVEVATAHAQPTVVQRLMAETMVHERHTEASTRAVARPAVHHGGALARIRNPPSLLPRPEHTMHLHLAHTRPHPLAVMEHTLRLHLEARRWMPQLLETSLRLLLVPLRLNHREAMVAMEVDMAPHRLRHRPRELGQRHHGVARLKLPRRVAIQSTSRSGIWLTFAGEGRGEVRSAYQVPFLLHCRSHKSLGKNSPVSQPLCALLVLMIGGMVIFI